MKEKLTAFIESSDHSSENLEVICGLNDEVQEVGLLGGVRLIRLLIKIRPFIEQVIDGVKFVDFIVFIRDNWDRAMAIVGKFSAGEWLDAILELIDLFVEFREGQQDETPGDGLDTPPPAAA